MTPFDHPGFLESIQSGASAHHGDALGQLILDYRELKRCVRRFDYAPVHSTMGCL